MNKCNPIPCDCKDGKVGMRGLKGSDGSDGAMGIQGIRGLDGNQGEQGDIGEQGPIGNVGITGDSGTSTIVGDQGSEGPQGEPGIDGLDGEKGPPGPNGVNGSSIGAYTISIAEQVGACGVSIGVSGSNSYCLFNSGADIIWFNRLPQTAQYAFRLPGSITASGVPDIGARVTIVSFVNSGRWIVQPVLNQKIQMTGGFETSFGTVASAFTPVLVNPTDPQLAFEPTNYTDCITFIHIGNEEWVVLKINNAGGVLPIFI